jgi:protein-S-isoprenylcysteine O-methyltransferase Ste14
MNLEKFAHNVHPHLFVTAGSLLVVLQIVLAIVFFNNGSSVLQNTGWIIMWIAAFFGVVPIIMFRRRGHVEKGKSYMHTRKLVDTGIYGIVRHPQNGVAWVLINLGLMFIAQHWSVVVTGAASMVCGYLDLYKEEERCVKKFGDEYTQYMEKVPRINVLLGIVRAIRS